MAGSISLATKPPIATANKLFIFASFSAPSPPSKPAFVKLAKRRRGNTLRPKILTEPYSPPQNPKSPVEAPEISSTEQNDAIIAFSPAGLGSDSALVEVSGKKFLARYGFYLVGAFVFQTVLAVWIIGNSSSDDDDHELNSPNGLKLDKGVSLLNENSDEIQFEERVEEIRIMAARARKDEKNKISDARSGNKTAVEREIGKRLSKLRKSSKSGRSGIIIGSEAKMGNDSLLFEKKFRFKGYSGDLGERTKGFGESVKSDKSTEGIEIVNGESINGNGATRNSREKFGGTKGFGGSAKSNKSSGEMVNGERFDRNGGKRFEGPKGFGGSAKSKASKVKKREEKVVIDKKSEEGKEMARVNNRQNDAIRSRRSRAGVIQERSSESKTPRDSKTGGDNLWWLNLHHIFVILMQRGSDPDGPAGLFTVGSSYAVAFADRGDATNFCFLLESFFEDLGDVSVDIVPMSAKELETAIESGNWKVIVVKKGQLEMYAGQPFKDVEIALQALVEEARTA